MAERKTDKTYVAPQTHTVRNKGSGLTKGAYVYANESLRRSSTRQTKDVEPHNRIMVDKQNTGFVTERQGVPKISDFAVKKPVSVDSLLMTGKMPESIPEPVKPVIETVAPKPTVNEIKQQTNVAPPAAELPVVDAKTTQEGDETMAIPKVDLEDYTLEETTVTEELQDEAGGSQVIGVIGSGQCGGRIAQALWEIGYKKALYVNTTDQDVNNIPNKIILNSKGQGGAGKDMSVAEAALEKNKEEVFNDMAKLFGQVHHIIICAGLGGGTGGGTIVGLVDIAKKYMRSIGYDDCEKRVGAIVTIPSIGEASSPHVAQNAFNKGTELSKLADEGKMSPLIIIDNGRIKELYQKIPVARFFQTINNTIAQMFHIFNFISTQSSNIVTLDAKDFSTAMECGGHMIFGVTVVSDFKTKTGISTALKTNLSKTLLASEFDLPTAKTVVACVVAGQQILDTEVDLQTSIDFGMDTLSAMCGKALMHRGVYPDEIERVRVYTLISGMKAPIKRYERLLK